jgi:uncharacterized protein YutD
MTNNLEDFRNHFSEVIGSVQKYAYIVRDSGYQKQSIDTLRELKRECSAHKVEAIEEKNEFTANAYLCFECITETLIKEFEFYIEIKNDNPDAAWDNLIDAQQAAADAVKSHEYGSYLEKYINKLYMLEKILFPTMAFFSTGFIVKKSVCSVCGTEYGECDHIKGKPYMGELCGRIIEEADLREVSVVFDPANKHCRVTSFTEDGITRNALTHRVIEEKK